MMPRQIPSRVAATSWSPNGKAIAFASTYGEFCPGSALYVVNADGTGLSALPGIEAARDPAWRPE